MENSDYQNHNICYLARIILEAETPLHIGSGLGNVLTDSAILRDANGLPFISGTTLQGLLRHALGDEAIAERIMGWQKGDSGRGSFLTISEAKLMDAEGNPVDGLHDRNEIEGNSFLSRFATMPIRQHTRISDNGTTVKGGKYDEEVIARGARFCFEVQLEADTINGERDFTLLLSHLNDSTFRIGGDSRKGFGKVKVIQMAYRKLDFNKPTEFKAYMDKQACLSTRWDGYEPWTLPPSTEQNITHYELRLEPLDFILFSSGLGNEDTDMAVIHEPFIEWRNGKGQWVDERLSLVVPASSVKGALAHRTAFHYNRLCKAFADDGNQQATTCTNSPAVRSLFGYAGDNNGKDKRRGRVLISDIVRKVDTAAPKILNHVKIDRFTGGAIDGALFDEQPLFAPEENIVFCVDVIGEDADKNIEKAFEYALKDICNGLLPLGGGVNRGNGRFKGKMFINGEEYYA